MVKSFGIFSFTIKRNLANYFGLHSALGYFFQHVFISSRNWVFSETLKSITMLTETGFLQYSFSITLNFRCYSQSILFLCHWFSSMLLNGFENIWMQRNFLLLKKTIQVCLIFWKHFLSFSFCSRCFLWMVVCPFWYLWSRHLFSWCGLQLLSSFGLTWCRHSL